MEGESKLRLMVSNQFVSIRLLNLVMERKLLSRLNMSGFSVGGKYEDKPDPPRDDGDEKQMLSYRGAAVNDRPRQNGAEGRHVGGLKGKTVVAGQDEIGNQFIKGPTNGSLRVNARGFKAKAFLVTPDSVAMPKLMITV